MREPRHIRRVVAALAIASLVATTGRAVAAQAPVSRTVVAPARAVGYVAAIESPRGAPGRGAGHRVVATRASSPERPGEARPPLASRDAPARDAIAVGQTGGGQGSGREPGSLVGYSAPAEHPRLPPSRTASDRAAHVLAHVSHFQDANAPPTRS